MRGLPCDVFLGAHGNYYGMLEKIKRRSGPVNPFLDPEGYKRFLNDSEKELQRRIAAEAGGR
jgi:metallo-beta-lactamase class B